MDAAAGTISATTPAWTAPSDWCAATPASHPLAGAPGGCSARGCSARGGSAHRIPTAARPPLAHRRYTGCADVDAPVRSASCVPDLPVAVSVSLDGGASFSPQLNLTYGHVPKLKVASPTRHTRLSPPTPTPPHSPISQPHALAAPLPPYPFPFSGCISLRGTRRRHGVDVRPQPGACMQCLSHNLYILVSPHISPHLLVTL